MLQGLGQGQPTEPAEATWESAEARLEKEEKALWNAEYEIRLRCDGLTQLEATELTNGDLWEGDQQCLHDVDKLMKFYGAASGGNASCKRLLKWMNEKHPVRAGTTSKWYSAQFLWESTCYFQRGSPCKRRFLKTPSLASALLLPMWWCLGAVIRRCLLTRHQCYIKLFAPPALLACAVISYLPTKPVFH